MDLLVLILPHIGIGVILGLAEGLLVRFAFRMRWLVPLIAGMGWTASLVYGIYNNPGGGIPLFLFLGCPAALLWSLGLIAGYQIGKGRIF